MKKGEWKQVRGQLDLSITWGNGKSDEWQHKKYLHRSVLKSIESDTS